MRARNRPPQALVNHRDVASLLGMPTRSVTDWIERGILPAPHARVGTLYFYRADDVRSFVDKGRWPDAMLKPRG